MDGPKHQYSQNSQRLFSSVCLGVKHRYSCQGKNKIHKIKAWCHFEGRSRGRRGRERAGVRRSRQGMQVGRRQINTYVTPTCPCLQSSVGRFLRSEILTALFHKPPPVSPANTVSGSWVHSLIHIFLEYLPFGLPTKWLIVYQYMTCTIDHMF